MRVIFGQTIRMNNIGLDTTEKVNNAVKTELLE
jgi:hypothetical protein